jgi:hypothetical protein
MPSGSVRCKLCASATCTAAFFAGPRGAPAPDLVASAEVIASLPASQDVAKADGRGDRPLDDPDRSRDAQASHETDALVLDVTEHRQVHAWTGLHHTGSGVVVVVIAGLAIVQHAVIRLAAPRARLPRCHHSMLPTDGRVSIILPG